jgi:hypothetical protein
MGQDSTTKTRWWKLFSSNSSSKTKFTPTPYKPLEGRGKINSDENNNKVFGIRLEQSLRYASVAISMVGQGNFDRTIALFPRLFSSS